jgi:signal transduction histidine kinase
MMEMCVRDHGIGIPPEQLERIFENFHRLDTRLTREVNGLGLGLAICKRIVELHGGTIWAESQVGMGSTFHVLLPVEGKARLDPHEDAQP